MTYPQSEAAALALFERPIAFHRILVTWTGSIKAALMLSQLIYWTRRTSNPHGWIYKTRDDWFNELGLERAEQENARKLLKDKKFVEERLGGKPAKMFYRVNPKIIRDLAQSELACNKPTKGLETSQLDGLKQANSSGTTYKDYSTGAAQARAGVCDDNLGVVPAGPRKYPPAVVQFSNFSATRGFHLRAPGPNGEARYKTGGKKGGWTQGKLDYWQQCWKQLSARRDPGDVDKVLTWYLRTYDSYEFVGKVTEFSKFCEDFDKIHRAMVRYTRDLQKKAEEGAPEPGEAEWTPAE